MVTATNPASASYSQGQSIWASQNDSLQDQFMQILLTQLRYQDPMEPMKEKDFFAQMAQFATASQMQNLNASMSWLCALTVENQLAKNLLEAAHLVGKQFEADTEQGTVTGVIEGVGFSGGRLVARCEGCEIPLESIVWIGGTVDGPEIHRL